MISNVPSKHWEVFNPVTTVIYMTFAHWYPEFIVRWSAIALERLMKIPVDYARQGEGY